MTESSGETLADQELRARLCDFGVESFSPGSVFDQLSQRTVNSWCVALDRALRSVERKSPETLAWIRATLQTIAGEPASVRWRTQAAEIDASLRLLWIGDVERVRESHTAPSVDLRVTGMNIEVSCPQEHTHEKEVVEAVLARQLESADGPVKVATVISHPSTGSGRRVDETGLITRDPNSLALRYPTNKLIDRVLHAKRDGRQFASGNCNVLWLDLKHGLPMVAVDCAAFRSVVSHGSCFTGIHGIWHAFYGTRGSPHFRERTALEWPVTYPTYEQHVQGWFRELTKVSAAVISVLDGVLLFENPWADTPLSNEQRRKMFRLSELRPEYSWTDCADTLEHDVEGMLARISWMSRLAGAED